MFFKTFFLDQTAIFLQCRDTQIFHDCPGPLIHSNTNPAERNPNQARVQESKVPLIGAVERRRSLGVTARSRITPRLSPATPPDLFSPRYLCRETFELGSSWRGRRRRRWSLCVDSVSGYKLWTALKSVDIAHMPVVKEPSRWDDHWVGGWGAVNSGLCQAD